MLQFVSCVLSMSYKKSIKHLKISVERWSQIPYTDCIDPRTALHYFIYFWWTTLCSTITFILPVGVVAWTANPQLNMLKRIMSSGAAGRMEIKFLLDDGNTWKASHLAVSWPYTLILTRHYCVTGSAYVSEKKKKQNWRLCNIVVKLKQSTKAWACMVIRKPYSDINYVSSEPRILIYRLQNIWEFFFILKVRLQCCTDIQLFCSICALSCLTV